jgi:predicted ATPase with chaperone activity
VIPLNFRFKPPTELDDLTEVIGQPRALEAVRFGIGITRDGYNLFFLGPVGVGKHFTARLPREPSFARACAFRLVLPQ